MSLGAYSQVVQNIRLVPLDDSQQIVGRPYKLNVSFDVQSSTPNVGGIGLWYYFITEESDTSHFSDWPIFGNVGGLNYDSVISGGFNFVYSDVLKLEDTFSAFPGGNYKITIAGYVGGSFFPLHVEQTFNINDICTNCNNGIYAGQDNDNDGLLDLFDNCDDNYNPNQEDIDNDGVGDVCDTGIIQNTTITAAADSTQIVGEPYKVNFSFDLNPTLSFWGQQLPPLWYYYITEESDHSTFVDWPIHGFINGNDYDSVIPGGYRFAIPNVIDINDTFSNFPSGNYKIFIVANQSNQNWMFFNDYEEYLEKYTTHFSISNCVDCLNNGIYPGHDDDNDGLLELMDNCPNTYNPNQEDVDGDGVGDACDNCPSVSNLNQLDTDNDGMGNICDDDDDNDGVLDVDDNCPLNANSNQLDTDNDGMGNVCDSDDDNDGIPDSQDSCPLVPNSGVDADNDGIDDACDDSIILEVDLTIESWKIKVGDLQNGGTITYNVYPGGQTPIILKNSNVDHEVKFKNQGNSTSSYFSNWILFSPTNTYPSANSYAQTLHTINSGNLSSGGVTQTYSVSQHVYNWIGSTPVYDDNYYYYTLHINNNNSVSETDYNNNIYSVKFKYESTNRYKVGTVSLNNQVDIPIYDTDNQYSILLDKDSKSVYSRKKVVVKNFKANIKIYKLNSLTNTPVYETNVFNENASINALLPSTGIYVIHVNDEYRLKFVN